MFAIDRLAGVLVALASPLKRDGSVDEPAFARLVEHVLAGGVHGLLPLGSTGEGAALDEAARRRVLSAVGEAGAGSGYTVRRGGAGLVGTGRSGAGSRGGTRV